MSKALPGPPTRRQIDAALAQLRAGSMGRRLIEALARGPLTRAEVETRIYGVALGSCNSRLDNLRRSAAPGLHAAGLEVVCKRQRRSSVWALRAVIPPAPPGPDESLRRRADRVLAQLGDGTRAALMIRALAEGPLSARALAKAAGIENKHPNALLRVHLQARAALLADCGLEVMCGGTRGARTWHLIRVGDPVPGAGSVPPEKLAALIAAVEPGSVRHALFSALAEGPWYGSQLAARVYQGRAVPADPLGALYSSLDSFAGVLDGFGLEIRRHKRGKQMLWSLGVVEGWVAPADTPPVSASPAPTLRHAARRVDIDLAQAPDFSVIADALERLAPGQLLVFHTGYQRPASPLWHAARQVAEVARAPIRSWPEDPATVQERRWSWAIERPRDALNSARRA